MFYEMMHIYVAMQFYGERRFNKSNMIIKWSMFADKHEVIEK